MGRKIVESDAANTISSVICGPVALLIANPRQSGLPAVSGLCHLPSVIAFQLAVMISGAIALASTLVVFGMLVFVDWHPGAPLTAITSVCLLAALLHFHPALKEKWMRQTEEERSLDDGHPDGAIRRSDEI